MFRKIITYFLILAAVLPILAAAVPLGGKINRAQAAVAPTEGYGNGSVSSPCDFKIIQTTIGSALAGISTLINSSKATPQTSVWHCTLYTVTFLLYEVVMRISIWITGFASDLFNVSIQFSLTGEAFDADKNPMIKDGWTYVRDLLNLVFIFILLFASISTILQYGNVDIKKILPSLIVVALLVNFSMLIAKMVIDASHIFAWEFYNQIDVENKNKLGNKEIFANMQGSVEVDRNFQKKNLASVFLAGFNPQRLLTGSGMIATTTIIEEGKTETKTTLPAWKNVYEHAAKNTNDIIGTLWKMILIILLESALAIFASFILLAGAIMFVARVAILWIVIIFSPLAFLGMILPAMQKHSSMWWKYLIDQSFFAPAFLFMFMLATNFINSDLVDKLLKVNENDDSKIVEGLQMGEIVVIFFNFFVVAFIFSLCLVVARQLGGKTADFGIKGAHKGKDLALGGAKKLAWSPTRYGLRFGGGSAADAILKGEGRISGALKAIPGVGVGLRKLGAMKKADEKEAEKKAEKYASGLSDSGYEHMKREKERGLVARVVYRGGVSKATRKGYENAIKKKKSDEEKRKRIKEEERELETLNKALPKMGPIKEHQKARLKEIEKDLEDFDVEIKAADYELAEAVKSKNVTRINNAKQKLKDIKKEPGLLGLKTEKKVREEKIKTIEKHEARKESLQEKKDRRAETTGLQETIKTSGGAGGSGGGSKTP